MSSLIENLGPRIIHDVVQGSESWHKLRLDYDGASEAAAMLGIDDKKSRAELLHEKHTGEKKEFSEWVQKNVLDHGHKVEEAARELLEEHVEETLYPVVCSRGRLLASCDGLTLSGVLAFEHKQWNKALAESVEHGIIPDKQMSQCQQILLVTGAKIIEFVVSDGTLDNRAACVAKPDSAWFERLILGWKQFNIDRAAYTPPEAVYTPIADTIEQLPAVIIRASGSVESNNLPAITPIFDAFLESQKTDLVTDDDFANGESVAKFSRATAKTLKAKSQEVIDQVASISEVSRLLEFYAAKFDKLGLLLEGAVKTQKQNIKVSITNAALYDYGAHVIALNETIAPIKLLTDKPNFVDAIKNQRTIKGLRAKVDHELNRAKIAADSIVLDITVKLDWYKRNVKSYEFLFSDLQQIIYKPIDDFILLAQSRVFNFEAAKAEAVEIATPVHISPELITPESDPIINNDEYLSLPIAYWDGFSPIYSLITGLYYSKPSEALGDLPLSEFTTRLQLVPCCYVPNYNARLVI